MASKNPTAADVRAWAASKGIETGKRGRISSTVVAAFNKGKTNKYATS